MHDSTSAPRYAWRVVSGAIPATMPCPRCGDMWVERVIKPRSGVTAAFCSKCRIRLDAAPTPWTATWVDSQDELIDLLGGGGDHAVIAWIAHHSALEFRFRRDGTGIVSAIEHPEDPGAVLEINYPLNLQAFWLQVDDLERHRPAESDCPGLWETPNAPQGGRLWGSPESHRRPTHFDGPMVSGGSGYTFAEIETGQPPTIHATGIRLLDSVTGGLQPGEIWSISGESGSGVTTLAVELAVGLQKSAGVLFCNSHVPTRDVVAMFRRSAAGQHVELEPGIRVASWQHAWHEPGGRRLHFDDAKPLSVVVLDTWDEQLMGYPHPRDLDAIVGTLRQLRELARRSTVGVVLTSRVPRSVGPSGRTAIEDALDDVSTVRIEIGSVVPDDGQSPLRTVAIRRRGRGGPAGFALMSSRGRASIVEVRH